MPGLQDDFERRLRRLAAKSRRPLAFMFGSGLSNASLPDTKSMTDLFLSELEPDAQRAAVASPEASLSAAAKYQEVARRVSLQCGDSTVSDVLRDAVLTAYTGPKVIDFNLQGEVLEKELQALTNDLDDWHLPIAYRDFATFYAGLPEAVQGPILTTNFDPFLEIALRQASLIADPLPMRFDSQQSTEQFRFSSTIQVCHLHGYYASELSINTVGQLNKARPQTEEFLKQVLTGTTVVVIGYGGWDDAFTRTLLAHAAYPSIANAEVLWCARSDSEAELLTVPVISALNNRPGFQLFTGIDGTKVFSGRVVRPTGATLYPLPRGFVRLPVRDEGEFDPLELSRGEQPSWRDASPRRWPLLGAGKQLLEAAQNLIERDASGIVAGTGPLGEGKSVALRQIAMELAVRQEDWQVLWREAGAPPLTPALAAETLGNHKSVMVLDDADLAFDDVQILREAAVDRLVIIMACQDRFWTSLTTPWKAQVNVLHFEGLSEDDAALLARYWTIHNIQPLEGTASVEPRDIEQTVKRSLISASQRTAGAQTNSLFGAILDVREAKTLRTRVGALMDSLDRVKIKSTGEITLADVFGSVCVQQQYLDPKGNNDKGATREFIARLAHTDSNLVDTSILLALGREAAITLAGKRIYARHPKIAELAVRWLVDNHRMVKVCELTGLAGGQLRQERLVTKDDYDAYMLGASVDEYEYALAACRGAIHGANQYIEPKITFMSVARRHRVLDTALEYARSVVPHINECIDRGSALRVFCSEVANILLITRDARVGTGMAALALHDSSFSFINPIQVRSGLDILRRSVIGLVEQRDEHIWDVARTLVELWERREGGSIAIGSLAPFSQHASVTELTESALWTRLSVLLSPYARVAIREWHLPFGPYARDAWQLEFYGKLSFGRAAATTV
jgi:hypothetical protein